MTRRETVRKTVGGVTFDDPYAWLRPESDEALAWQQRQTDDAVSTAQSVPFFADLVEAVKRPHASSDFPSMTRERCASSAAAGSASPPTTRARRRRSGWPKGATTPAASSSTRPSCPRNVPTGRRCR